MHHYVMDLLVCGCASSVFALRDVSQHTIIPANRTTDALLVYQPKVHIFHNMPQSMCIKTAYFLNGENMTNMCEWSTKVKVIQNNTCVCVEEVMFFTPQTSKLAIHNLAQPDLQGLLTSHHLFAT